MGTEAPAPVIQVLGTECPVFLPAGPLAMLRHLFRGPGTWWPHQLNINLYPEKSPIFSVELIWRLWKSNLSCSILFFFFSNRYSCCCCCFLLCAQDTYFPRGEANTSGRQEGKMCTKEPTMPCNAVFKMLRARMKEGATSNTVKKRLSWSN